MPGKHREFFQLVSKLPNLRLFVAENQSHKELSQAYEDCIQQLRSWRGKHIAVVSKYIVQPARLAAQGALSDATETMAGNAVEQQPGEELQGSGGSALIPFLKQSRDETVGLQLN